MGRYHGALGRRVGARQAARASGFSASCHCTLLFAGVIALALFHVASALGPVRSAFADAVRMHTANRPSPPPFEYYDKDFDDALRAAQHPRPVSHNPDAAVVRATVTAPQLPGVDNAAAEAFLQEFYSATNGPNWTTPLLAGQTICSQSQWPGIACSSDGTVWIKVRPGQKPEAN